MTTEKKRIADILAGLSSKEPFFETLQDAFEELGFEMFEIIGSSSSDDPMSQFQAAAEIASKAIPCCACGGDVLLFEKVGWASLITEDELEQPVRIKAFRLCQPCGEKAVQEDREIQAAIDFLGEVLATPYIEKLIFVYPDGNHAIAANWGCFNPKL